MKETIQFDDVQKLDIRVGVITGAEAMPGADKLLVLAVDVGDEESRQVIAGIAPHVSDPVDLIGSRCPFVCNLEPRTLRGYESQAMILVAHADDLFSLLEAHKDIPAGTPVR